MSREVDLAHQLWTRAFTDFRPTYEEVAEAGVKSVVLTERRGEYDLNVREQALEAGRILEELGLQVLGCHGCEAHPCDLGVLDRDDHELMVRKHSTLMERVAELGCQAYVVHLGKRPANAAEAWGQVRRAVDELGALAERLGVALALENGMQGYLASNEDLIGFVAEYHHPAVGICYDAGHAHIMGDAAQALRQMSPDVVTVHLHDNRGVDDEHLIPGLGTIDWPSVAAALADCPRLLHAETEAANHVAWPHSPDPWPQKDLWARYLEVLNVPGTDVVYG